MGAPKGNQNAMKHGKGLSLGSLPPGCSYIKRQTNLLDRELQALTLQVHGAIGPVERMLIQTAIRHERHAQLAQRWLRLNAEVMSHDVRLAYSREIARASSARDKAIAELDLRAKQDDILAGLYGPAALSEPPGDERNSGESGASDEVDDGDQATST